MKHIEKKLKSKVLYQKLANKWYVFTEVDGKILYSKLDDNIDPAITPIELIHITEESPKPTARMVKEILT
ncbi:MAG: hypothetical protein OXB84_04155 [Halobacteriovoraceae bacterium]|nr:hypothetical protein [Halobacteriovoraceae bacterium]